MNHRHLQFRPPWVDRLLHRTPSDRFVLTGPDAIALEELNEQLCILLFNELGVTRQRNLGLLPLELRTPAVCLAAVESDVGQCQHFPAEAWGERFVLDLFARCGPKRLWLAFGHIPDALKTPSICLQAVRSNGCALRHVPPHLRTDDLCVEALRNNGAALDYVPAHMRTLESFRIAIASNPVGVPALIRDEPLSLEQTRELYLIGVSHNGRAVEEMLAICPDAVDAEVARRAVAQNPCVLDLLPPALRDAAALDVPRESLLA